MAWYAYCITEQKAFLGSARSRRPFPVDGLNGVRGSQVFAYPSGELAVIVSEYMPGELNQQAVIEHARVVSECFRNKPCGERFALTVKPLPTRFPG